MGVIEVKDVQEAVELASKWKAEGRYDWFRGQTHPWKIVSSLGRAKEPQEKVREKLGRFEGWLKSTPGVEPIAKDENMFFAVAQHYGIPTNYIDFTTDPSIAGFFATHGQNLETGQECCIYCLDTKDLKAFWRDIRKVMIDYPEIDFVKIHVKDLWRLQAQHGVFLYCPFRVLEDLYSIDMISFPYTGTLNKPIEEIYPTRKSHLEILLDQYFGKEVRREGGERIRALARKFNWRVTTLSSTHGLFDEFFHRENLRNEN